MTPHIKFGTDGWRGVIADDFTFDNIAKVALATANFYKRHKKIKNESLLGTIHVSCLKNLQRRSQR